MSRGRRPRGGRPPPERAKVAYALPARRSVLKLPTLLRSAHRDDIGCLIMEPIVSSSGYLPGDPDFLRGIRKLTEELGVVLVFDEVQSFRVAPGGAQELLGVTSAGLPPALAAVARA